MGSIILEKIKYLFSGSFALVMATGALSIGTYLLGMTMIAHTLLVVNIVAFLILWVLTLIRLIKFFPEVIADLTSHANGPGFFTLVAGTCVFGSQLIIVLEHYAIARVLWYVAILLWIMIMYTFFTAVTIRKNKPTIAEGINGAWLIATVATQSIAILGTLLLPYLVLGVEIVLFFTICMYFLGCMLYLNIITLIFYRFTFVEFKYEAFSLPYWINMGAVAITTLSGATLILHADNFPLLTEITPFLKGFTLFFWITGTWWMPLLFILMIWRYIYHHYPLTYDPQFWGMVFPLAMYTTSTYQLSEALQLPFLLIIPKIMVFIALTAWVFSFLRMLAYIGRLLRAGYKKA